MTRHNTKLNRFTYYLNVLSIVTNGAFFLINGNPWHLLLVVVGGLIILYLH